MMHAFYVRFGDIGMTTFDRRKFLQSLAATGLSLAGRNLAFAATDTHTMPPAQATAGFNPDVELDLNAVTGEADVLPGGATRIWHYTGHVVRGNSQTLSFLDGSRHMPIIRVRRGQKVRINFTNRLPEESIVHW